MFSVSIGNAHIDTGSCKPRSWSSSLYTDCDLITLCIRQVGGDYSSEEAHVKDFEQRLDRPIVSTVEVLMSCLLPSMKSLRNETSNPDS